MCASRTRRSGGGSSSVEMNSSAAPVREQLHISETEWQALAENQSGELIRTAVQAIVRRVVYDGARGAVSVELGDED